jgi:hypothetical protein
MRFDKLRSASMTALMLVVVAPMGCLDEGAASAQAICVLIDVSGTYADQKHEVVKVIKRDVLPSMIPGDTLITILIDSASYEKDNLRTLATLDPRPSRANAQKLALAQQLDVFARGDTRSRYTDLPGAMMLAAEYLQETGSGSRVMLVFSNLQEELPDGAKRNMREDEFAGIQVVAMNVKRLESDTVDPEIFRQRIEGWRTRVEHSGAQGWRTIMDPSKLPALLDEIRS